MQEDYVRKQTIKEMIELADKIEVERTSIEDKDEWYGFKRFRNEMSDKLEELEK